MPKLKSNRGASKRFRVTASGRVKRRSANRNHILTKKPRGRLRRLAQPGSLKSCDARLAKRMVHGS